MLGILSGFDSERDGSHYFGMHKVPVVAAPSAINEPDYWRSRISSLILRGIPIETVYQTTNRKYADQSCGCDLLAQVLEDPRRALSAADTHGNHAVAGAAPFHLVQ